MNGSSRLPIEISIFDNVVIEGDLSATIVRRYTFTNPNDEPETIELSRTEVFTTPVEDFRCTTATIEIQVLPLQSGRVYQAPWSSTRSHSLGSEEEIVVEFSFKRDFLNIVPPVVTFEYSSTERVLYSIEITPYWPSLFRLSQITITPPPLDPQMSSFLISQEGALIVSERRISANKGGQFSLTIQPNPPHIETLELLKVMANDANDNGASLAGISVILILHLLTDFLSFIDALETIGLDPERTFIVGIPYSLKEHVIVRLLARGYKHIWGPANYPFLTEVDAAINAAASYGDTDARNLLIIEDGGYVVPRLHSHYPELIPRVIGAVEQTANGIWAYQESVPPRKRRIATMNVAESDLKKRRESPHIGDAVFRNVTRLLETDRVGVREKQVLIIGFGATGSHVANVFKNNGAKVTVFDEKRKRRSQAKADGFDVAGNIDEAISDKFLVIGCTGKVSVKINSLLRADHGTYFVNASSKRLEVDHRDLKSITNSVEQIPNVGSKYHLVNGRDLTILADGYPVNFHGLAESVPDKELQFIYGLLFGSAVHVCQNQDLKPGLVYVPEDMQKTIEDLHRALLSI
jgi:S-adenosylhomocysteine hydrolase